MVYIKLYQTPKCLLYRIIVAPFILIAIIILWPFEMAGRCCVKCGAKPIDDSESQILNINETCPYHFYKDDNIIVA